MGGSWQPGRRRPYRSTSLPAASHRPADVPTSRLTPPGRRPYQPPHTARPTWWQDGTMTVIRINAIEFSAGLGRVLEATAIRPPRGAVDGAAGFEGFELLRPSDGPEHLAGGGRWRDEESFRAWDGVTGVCPGHRGPVGPGPWRPAGGPAQRVVVVRPGGPRRPALREDRRGPPGCSVLSPAASRRPARWPRPPGPSGRSASSAGSGCAYVPCWPTRGAAGRSPDDRGPRPEGPAPRAPAW